MPRSRTWVWMGVVGLLIVARASSAEAARPTEELLPDTTAGFAAVSNVEELSDRWSKTQLGELMADEELKAFSDDLRRQFEDQWSGLRDKLGLTLDDLKGVPGGEVAVALLLERNPKATGEDVARLAVVIDVTGHLPQAKALLEKVTKNLKAQGAKRSEITLPDYASPVVRFDDLPKLADDVFAEPGTAFYTVTDELLIVSDDLDVLKGILARAAAESDHRLADVPAFKAVTERCRRDNEGQTPQIRWFLDPLDYAAAIRAATPEQNRRKGKSVLEVLRSQGLGAVQGIGGFVDLYVTDRLQLVHRTFVYAPRPDQYRKSMKMVVLPNATEFDPQRWVPRDVATYATFYFDILNAFDNLGPLFDEMFGGIEYLFSAKLTCQADLDQGKIADELRQNFEEADTELSPEAKVFVQEPGAAWEIDDQGETYTISRGDGALKVYAEMHLWPEVLQSLKEDAEGPQIDLREELIKNLGQRITVITAYEEPITPTSERLLVAIEATNEDALRAALKKTMQTDPNVVRREFEDLEIWEMVEEPESDLPEIPTISIPSLTGEDTLTPKEKSPLDEAEEEIRLLPHAAVTVAHGHLFVASERSFLEKVLAPREPRDMLGANVDCQLVQAAVKEMGMTQRCVWSFSRTDEEYRPTYELIRQGKMPEGETVLARVLNAMFSTGKKGELRAQKIDGEEMPEYDVVRRYLGAASVIVGSEPDGWFAKGFALKKGT